MKEEKGMIMPWQNAKHKEEQATRNRLTPNEQLHSKKWQYRNMSKEERRTSAGLRLKTEIKELRRNTRGDQKPQDNFDPVEILKQ